MDIQDLSISELTGRVEHECLNCHGDGTIPIYLTCRYPTPTEICEWCRGSGVDEEVECVGCSGEPTEIWNWSTINRHTHKPEEHGDPLCEGCFAGYYAEDLGLQEVGSHA